MTIKDFIKAKYLIEKDSVKNWFFVGYIALIGLFFIWNTLNYEDKVLEYKQGLEELKELRSEFVDVRSGLMRLKMESNVSKRMESLEIYPSAEPPKKIKIISEEKQSSLGKWVDSLWK